MKFFDLTEEEKQILVDFEKDKLIQEKKARSEKKRLKGYARHTLSKTKNINIRLSQKDLLKIKSKAVAEGIPYQTLVTSILHRFTSLNT